MLVIVRYGVLKILAQRDVAWKVCHVTLHCIMSSCHVNCYSCHYSSPLSLSSSSSSVSSSSVVYCIDPSPIDVTRVHTYQCVLLIEINDKGRGREGYNRCHRGVGGSAGFI